MLPKKVEAEVAEAAFSAGLDLDQKNIPGESDGGRSDGERRDGGRSDGKRCDGEMEIEVISRPPSSGRPSPRPGR